MKKVIGILFGIAVLTVLVLTPPGETVKMYKMQSVEMIQADVINIDGIELQFVNPFNPLNVLEVGIMPGYSSECMYIAKIPIYNKDNSIYNNRQFGNNYLTSFIWQDSYNATALLHRKAIEHKDYKGVGISPGVIFWHCNDATT